MADLSNELQRPSLASLASLSSLASTARTNIVFHEAADAGESFAPNEAKYAEQYSKASYQRGHVAEETVKCFGGWTALSEHFFTIAKSPNASKIFNPDSKRSQVALEPDDEFIAKIIKPLVANYNAESEQLQLGKSYVLYSEAGCKRQQWHVDYDPVHCQNSRQKPMSLLLSVMEGTKFTCFVGGVVTVECLSPGDYVLFDGDLIHAGAHYEEENVRFHTYVDVAGSEVKDMTWLVNI